VVHGSTLSTSTDGFIGIDGKGRKNMGGEEKRGGKDEIMSMCLRYYASMNLSWKTVGRQNIESLAMFCIRASMNLLFWQFGESNRFLCDSGGNFFTVYSG